MRCAGDYEKEKNSSYHYHQVGKMKKQLFWMESHGWEGEGVLFFFL
jgi:hypothetical protein